MFSTYLRNRFPQRMYTKHNLQIQVTDLYIDLQDTDKMLGEERKILILLRQRLLLQLLWVVYPILMSLCSCTLASEPINALIYLKKQTRSHFKQLFKCARYTIYNHLQVTTVTSMYVLSRYHAGVPTHTLFPLELACSWKHLMSRAVLETQITYSSFIIVFR